MRSLLRWCVLSMCLWLAGCGMVLYSSLSEQDANEVMAELARGGIRSSKESADGKLWAVKIAEADMARSLDRLKAAALPKARHASMGDLFEKDNLISTPAEERVRYVYALSEELSRTLSLIDGVVTARVHVVVPVNDPLATRVQPSSASVFIKHRSNVDVQYLSASIKNLVVKSIEGLSFENVSVSFFPAAVTEDRQDGTVPSARLLPMGMDTGDFSVRDIVFLCLGVFGLLIGSIVAWRLSRGPRATARTSDGKGAPRR